MVVHRDQYTKLPQTTTQFSITQKLSIWQSPPLTAKEFLKSFKLLLAILGPADRAGREVVIRSERCLENTMNFFDMSLRRTPHSLKYVVMRF